MKIRTKTKERLLSEGWYEGEGHLYHERGGVYINKYRIHLLGCCIDATDMTDGCYSDSRWVWTPEMIETKEEQVLRILKEYESRRQSGN